MNFIRSVSLACLAVWGMTLVGCNHRSTQNGTPNMTALTPRLQAIFDRTKPVCFGRFVVDVPESALVVWGDTIVDLGIVIAPGGASQVNELARKFTEELKSTEAIYHDHVPLFLSEEHIDEPPGKIITGYEGFDAVNGLKINGYFSWGNDGIVIDALPLQQDRSEAVADIKSIAQRLRPRRDDEIPAEPGNCLEYGFLKDKLVAGAEPPVEHIRIGFRLKEFPDTHLSILVGPSNPYHSEGNSLEWQLARLEERQRAEDANHPMLKTVYFRRGPRQIHGWSNGWEAISRSPDQPGVYGTHDFAMDVQGVPKDVFRPYADIQMQTGVGDNAAGAVKPSLTDDEAVAVWDRITSSIRVRPTGMSAGARAEPVPPRRPLGELAATGHPCPQAGWWEPGDTGLPLTGRRKRFKAGEPMPQVVMAGPQNWWQKIRGERPTFRAATVWRLVGYDEKAPTSGASKDSPSVASGD